MVKSKKKKNPNDLKKQVCIYIDKDLHDFARENGLNVSGIANNAINRLRLGLGEDFKTESADLVLISKNNGKNSLENAARGLRSPDLGIMSPAP